MLDIEMSNQKRATKDQKPAARKLATRPATRNQLLETGNMQPEKKQAIRKPETKNQKPETKKQKPKASCQKSATRNHKPEISNQRPDTSNYCRH